MITVPSVSGTAVGRSTASAILDFTQNPGRDKFRVKSSFVRPGLDDELLAHQHVAELVVSSKTPMPAANTVRAPAGQSRPDAAGHRGNDPLGHAGEGVHAHGAPLTPPCKMCPSPRGESVLLSYVSANRDEDVFADPFRFDVGRDPNKHVAFGYGVHFCLGAALARMEVNSFFAELGAAAEVDRAHRQARAHRRRSSSAGSSTCRSATSWLK